MQHPPTRRHIPLLSASLLALCQGVGMAQAETLPALTVTAPAERPAEGTLTVESQQLPARRATTSDSAQLLRALPGVAIQGAGGVSGLPVVQGLADDRLRITVDGMNLISACGNHMNPPLSYIAPSSVSRIALFAGITPVSLGGDSIGATIVVESPPLPFAETPGATLQQGELGGYYRSNNSAFGLNAAAHYATDRFSLGYRGSTARAENYHAGKDFKSAGPAAAGRRELAGDEVGSSFYQAHNHAIDLGVRNDDHLLELKLGIQDIPNQGWPNQRMDMTGNDSRHLNLRYEGLFDWGVLEGRAYQERTRHAMQFSDDKLFWYGPNATAPATDGIPGPISGGMNGYAAGMPMDTKGDNRGVRLHGEIALGVEELLRIGAETQHYRLHDWWDPSGKGMWPEVFWNIHNGQRDRLAAFGEWEAQWNPQWLTQLGLRYEQVRMSAGEVQGYNSSSAHYGPEAEAFNAAQRQHRDHNIDLAALARFTPERGYSVEFGVARKNRSPNLYERYTWSTGGMAMRMINMTGDGNGYVGNLDLEPEVAHTLRAEVAWHDPEQQRWALRLAPHYTHVRNFIDAERCQSANSNCGPANQSVTEQFVYLQFVNQSARLYGLDLSGQRQLVTQSAIGDLTLSAKVSALRGENRTTGDRLYAIMPLHGTFALEQQQGRWGNTLELEWSDDKDRISQVRNERPTGGYALLHLRSHYQQGNLRLDFGVENLLDRFYHHPLGGAYSGQGKTMSGHDVPWGVAVPGMGRSLYMGVNLAF